MVFTMFKFTENMFYVCICPLNFSYAKMWTNAAKSQNFINISGSQKPTWSKFLEIEFFLI